MMTMMNNRCYFLLLTLIEKLGELPSIFFKIKLDFLN